jgi:hypothetical protein
LFLTSVSLTGLNLRLAEDLLYVCASLVFLTALRLYFKNRIAVLVGFLIVLFNPMTFSSTWTDMLRQSFYLSITLLFLSSLLAINKYATSVTNKVSTKSISWSLLCGSALGIAWITREESIWMVFTLMPLIGYILYRSIKGKTLKPLTSILIIVAVSAAIPALISAINYKKYGYFGVVDIKEKQFSRAWDGVLSLNTSKSDWYMHFNQETKEKMLAISPDTRILILDLLNSDGEYKRGYRGISGGRGIWKFRSAAAHTGAYENFDSTRQYFKGIADDIESYCDLEPNSCVKPIASKLLWKDSHLAAFIPMVYKTLSQLTNLAYESYAPKLRTEKNLKGDSQFKRAVFQFFNMESEFTALSTNTNIERPSHGDIRFKTINIVFGFYQKHIKSLLIIASFGLIAMILSRKLDCHLPNLVTVTMGFSTVTGICVLVALTAYPHIARPLMTASIPLLMGIGYLACFVIILGFGLLNRTRSQ